MVRLDTPKPSIPTVSAMTQVRPGVLIATIVFALFAAYAFLAPATYRTNAILVLEPSAGASGASNLPEPLEAARRLRESILDRPMLQQLSRERAGSDAPEARALASSAVRQSLDVDTSDARTFSVSYRDSDKVRTQRACNLLARHAIERAPSMLVDRSAELAGDVKRREQTRELAAFLALHPQVAAETPASGSTSPDNDQVLIVFFVEKKNLQRRILEVESGVGSDNPYLDPAESDLTLLKRRLVEIDAASAARRHALEAEPSGNPLPPALRAEWKRLLELLSQSTAEAQVTARPAPVAHLASEAPLPSSPIDPNRPLLLFFGVVFGLGLGAAYVFATANAQQRRHKSSRPPEAQPRAHAPAQPPAHVGYTVQLPGAPPLPSGLGAPVPSLPLRPAHAPPIVPSQTRQISSSPPGPAGDDVNTEASMSPISVSSVLTSASATTRSRTRRMPQT